MKLEITRIMKSNWNEMVECDCFYSLPHSAFSANITFYKSGLELCFTTNTNHLEHFLLQFQTCSEFKKQINHYLTILFPGFRSR